jgi:hypothetical protein
VTGNPCSEDDPIGLDLIDIPSFDPHLHRLPNNYRLLHDNGRRLNDYRLLNDDRRWLHHYGRDDGRWRIGPDCINDSGTDYRPSDNASSNGGTAGVMVVMVMNTRMSMDGPPPMNWRARPCHSHRGRGKNHKNYNCPAH